MRAVEQGACPLADWPCPLRAARRSRAAVGPLRASLMHGRAVCYLAPMMAPHLPSFMALLGALAGVPLAACDDLARPVEPSSRQHPLQGDARRGQRLMAHYQCTACHAIPGVPGPAGEMVGPPLDAFGLRSYIAGHIPNDDAALQAWLRSPPSLVPGTAMPDLGVSEADARDMAAYLRTLR